METAESGVLQTVKPNKYCSCGYKCDCLHLIVKNKISTKRLFLRLEKEENESDINLALSLNEFGFDEIINQFNHFKYCKAYHSIFHEKRLNRIKRKPFAFYCLHHVEQLSPSDKPHIIHQLIDSSDGSSTDLESNPGEAMLPNGGALANHHRSHQYLKENSLIEGLKLRHELRKIESSLQSNPPSNHHHHSNHSNHHENHPPNHHQNHQDLNEIMPNENESLISAHDFVHLNNLSNMNPLNHYEANSIDLKEIKCVDEDLSIKFRNSLDLHAVPDTQPDGDEPTAARPKKGQRKKKSAKRTEASEEDRRRSLGKSCCSKFTQLRRYLNPFLCLLNILLIIVDFLSDILIARYHFISENYISTAVTFCFIYWAAYMHFLFETNLSKKLDLFRRKFRFINLNNVSADLIIGVVHLFLPVKIFIESIYLVYNMYKWELRLINCRNEDKQQDIEVVVRSCLRRAHKSNLIMALFKAFPQFLYQYYHYVYYMSEGDPLNWLFIVTITSSLITYIKNSYCGDLYYIEDNLNKNFEELRFLNTIKFNYLPFKFNVVLFIYNVCEFLINFPFFLIFYSFKSFPSILSTLKSLDVYLFIFYIILFFKSYVSFFKNYLASMKLEKDEDANWKKDVLFIRKHSHSHVNYLFILRIAVSCVFLFSLSNTFSAKHYYLILFLYVMLLAITALGYLLKTTFVADQLINLKNFVMWKGIFSHLENLNGFSIWNEQLFNQWIEKIIFENYYFQFKVLVYNVYHIFFKRN